MRHDRTREGWLRTACQKMIQLFDLPPRGPWRVTCGWPSKRATATNGRVLGQCWSSSCSADSTIELIVSITLDDPVEVLAVAAHELIHASLPEGTGHRAPFARKARAIGLDGKPTATTPGPAFVKAIAPLLEDLGSYPHASLDIAARKKQSTRMKKASCAFCGYTVRLSRKWLEVAVPRCPVHELEMQVDV